MPVREEEVAQLTCMGFPEEQARNALQSTVGNLEMAINLLLSGGSIGSDGNNEHGASVVSSFGEGGSNRHPFVATTAAAVVRGSTSQYSHGLDGRSACTCIALAAAESVANHHGAAATNDEPTIMTTEFLDRSIEEGVSRYRTLRQRSSNDAGGSSNNDIEHLSADEVLRKDEVEASSSGGGKQQRLFGVRVVRSTMGGGGQQRIVQGALSRDIGHPLGLRSVLTGLVRDVRDQRRTQNGERTSTSMARGEGNNGCGNGDSSTNTSNGNPSPMLCILLTKTPETVLLCLPSAADDYREYSSSSTKGRYWLVDSHPRPHLRGVETSYAKPHDTMESLLRSLRDIFPFTDLGPDVPPMMSDMYNMFDLYVLEGRT